MTPFSASLRGTKTDAAILCVGDYFQYSHRQQIKLKEKLISFEISLR
jgi:hypothetical protein